MKNVEVPFFSVIVPLFNKAPHVARSVGSVLDQSFADFELIIINDASTDSSVNEVEKFNDPRIRLLHRSEPGAGGYAARNLGIKEARAEWIAFLDADDEWYPNHLQVMFDAVRFNNVVFASSSWADMWPDGRLVANHFSRKYAYRNSLCLDATQYLTESIKGCSPVHTNTIVVRKDNIENVGCFPENKCKRGGDLDTWLRIVVLTDEILCLPIITSIYHREASTVTLKTKTEIQENCLYQTAIELITKFKSKRFVRKIKKYSNLHMRYAMWKRVTSGDLCLTDCRYHFSQGDFPYYVFFVFLACLSSKGQIVFYSFYKQAKKWLQNFIPLS